MFAKIRAMKQIHFSLFFFTLFVFISHVVLPISGKHDFFIFSRWSLFSGAYTNSIDISWNEGESFLFRDHPEVVARLKDPARIL